MAWSSVVGVVLPVLMSRCLASEPPATAAQLERREKPSVQDDSLPDRATPVADTEKDLDSVRKESVTQGRVCPDPAHPCGDDFKPNELSFEIAKKFDFDRGEDRSKPFFAIMLKSGPLCGIADADRLEVQALFPTRKVFLHRYFCEDFGDNVGYTNANKQAGFLAVYGGDNAAEAEKALAEVKATGRFPDANVREMQVYVTYQLE